MTHGDGTGGQLCETLILPVGTQLLYIQVCYTEALLFGYLTEQLDVVCVGQTEEAPFQKVDLFTRGIPQGVPSASQGMSDHIR